MAAIWFDVFTFHRCCWIVYHWIDISILIDVLLHPCLVMLVIIKLYQNLWPLSTFKSRLCPLHATILFLFESTQRDTDGASSYVFWLVCIFHIACVFTEEGLNMLKGFLLNWTSLRRPSLMMTFKPRASYLLSACEQISLCSVPAMAVSCSFIETMMRTQVHLKRWTLCVFRYNCWPWTCHFSMFFHCSVLWLSKQSGLMLSVHQPLLFFNVLSQKSATKHQAFA